MKARTKEEFEAVWKEHVRELSKLAASLPEEDWNALRDIIAKLGDLVKKAVAYAYPEKGEEKDATDDQPKHEESRRDYGTERGEAV